MFTDFFLEREKFYHVVLRLKQERTLSWGEAWKIVARADSKINDRVLFKTVRSFTEWRLRYAKEGRMSTQTIESELKIDELHDFCGISEGQYLKELFATESVHVNQLNRKGRSWVDAEEAGREKRIATLIREHEQRAHTRITERKRKRARTFNDRIRKGAARKGSARTLQDAHADSERGRTGRPEMSGK